MYSALLIGVGGCLGTLARAGINVVFDKFCPLEIKGVLATFFVNILGSLLIGACCSLFTLKPELNASLRGFVVVGLLGGFTTFSSFSFDNFCLLKQGNYLFFAANILGQVIFSLLAVMFGYILGRIIFSN